MLQPKTHWLTPVTTTPKTSTTPSCSRKPEATQVVNLALAATHRQTIPRAEKDHSKTVP